MDDGSGDVRGMLGDITLWTRVELAKILDRPVEEIDSAYTFARLGIDSGMATHLLIALEEQSVLGTRNWNWSWYWNCSKNGK
jgi:hypothetical protein